MYYTFKTQYVLLILIKSLISVDATHKIKMYTIHKNLHLLVCIFNIVHM